MFLVLNSYIIFHVFIGINLLKIYFYDLIKNISFRPWLVWLNGLHAGLQTKGSLLFLVRAHARVVGQVPS